MAMLGGGGWVNQITILMCPLGFLVALYTLTLQVGRMDREQISFCTPWFLTQYKNKPWSGAITDLMQIFIFGTNQKFSVAASEITI